MSYCRFENTARDMKDCLYAIEYGETDQLSDYEVQALEDFLSFAKDIVNWENEINEILENYGNKKFNNGR